MPVRGAADRPAMEKVNSMADIKFYATLILMLALIAAGVGVAWHEHSVGFDAGVSDCATRLRAQNVKGNDACASAIKDLLATAQAATDKRDTAAVAVATSTRATAATDLQTIKTTTAAAVQKVIHDTRTIRVPADCPGLPSSVRDAGIEAVQRANAAQGRLRAGQH